MLRIGIDIGGTFTDFVVYDPDEGSLRTFKILTDNKDPSAAVLHGLSTLGNIENARIIHGSTVATNALLERKGARTALITSKGFKDVLLIGRQNRPDLYNWNTAPPPPLVPAELRLEVNERVDSQGFVHKPLDFSEIYKIIEHLEENKVRSVAVCLLFSFLYPRHEQEISRVLRDSGFLVSTSIEILPEYREYERTSTTAVNAYVSPILESYLSKLEPALRGSNLQVMQSNGGMINLLEAKNNGARCILSGPAGGIIGAQYVAQSMIAKDFIDSPDQKVKVITFDMGGTSTDVSLINGEPTLTTDAVVGGCPIHLPLLDIHTIGAGGGSIAYLDEGGSLRVGPQSAGAEPGPACYGKGEFPTVTDANLVLGRLIPDFFLGGAMPIYPDRAKAVISNLANQMGISLYQAAFGIIDVVNIQMERALRVISVDRGHDPRDYSLFSFGGAGGLHASSLAHQLGISRVIVSRYASTLSAFGMLTSNVVKDYVQTVMLTDSASIEILDALFSPLVARGINDVYEQGIPKNRIDAQKSLDVRYYGQSYELNIPFSTNFQDVFQTAHTKAYGYAYLGKKIEIVNIRVRVIGKIPPIKLPVTFPNSSRLPPQPESASTVYLSSEPTTIPMYKYDHLLPGACLVGPALIVSQDTTILINPGDNVNLDDYLNIVINVENQK